MRRVPHRRSSRCRGSSSKRPNTSMTASELTMLARGDAGAPCAVGEGLPGTYFLQVTS